MADIVNLNRARKKKHAVEKKKTAERNRAKFGRPKAEKEKERMAKALLENSLDAHRRDTEE